MEENAHTSIAENNTIFATEHCINYSEHVGATIPLFYNVLGNGGIKINEMVMNETNLDKIELQNIESITDENMVHSKIYTTKTKSYPVVYRNLKYVACKKKVIGNNRKLWVNDGLIDFFIACIKIDTISNKNNTTGIFPAQFINQLCYSDTEIRPIKYNEKFLTYYDKKDLSEFDMMIIPAWDNLHWRMYVINKTTKIFEIVCSFHGEIDQHELKEIVKYISTVSETFFGDDIKDWKFIYGRENLFQKQSDAYNCGIYVILFVFHVVYGIKLRSFSEDECYLIRRRLHKAISIIANEYNKVSRSKFKSKIMYLPFFALFNQIPPNLPEDVSKKHLEELKVVNNNKVNVSTLIDSIIIESSTKKSNRLITCIKAESVLSYELAMYELKRTAVYINIFPFASNENTEGQKITTINMMNNIPFVTIRASMVKNVLKQEFNNNVDRNIIISQMILRSCSYDTIVFVKNIIQEEV